MTATVFTVGHGMRPVDELARVLEQANVTEVIDVRRYPSSRRNPAARRDALEAGLSRYGIAYEWRGDALGGRRRGRPDSRHAAWQNPGFRAYADHMESDAFRAALTDLRRDARRHRVAIMCAETLWWRCHRRLIADALVAGGERVVHLIDHDKSQEHRLHPAARVEEGCIVYDVGVTPPLGLDGSHHPG